MFCCKVLCFLVLLTVKSTESHFIYVNNSETLSYYLCAAGNNHHLQSGSVLLLSSYHQYYTIPSITHCLVKNLVNITLTATSPVHVTCSTNGAQPTTSFGFLNITNLSLNNIRFHGCGGYLNRFLLRHTNNLLSRSNSQLVVPNTQTTVLSFVDCHNLNISNITIDEKYFGYAVMLINTKGHITINKSSIKNSTNCSEQYCQGSGILAINLQHSTTWTMHEVNFMFNHNKYLSNKNPLDGLFHGLAPIDLFGAGGLTIITETPINVYMDNLSFKRNEGNIVGGCMILYYTHVVSLNVVIESSWFLENRLTEERRGAGFAVFVIQKNYYQDQHQSNVTITVIKTSISENYGAIYGSGVYIQLPNSPFIDGSILFTDCFFMLNTAKTGGHALYYITSTYFSTEETVINLPIDVVVKNAYIARNGVPWSSSHINFNFVHIRDQDNWALYSGSTLEFVNVRSVIVKGKTTLIANIGSAIAITKSNLTLTGIIVFKYVHAL